MLPVSMVGRAGELAELDRAWSSVVLGRRRSPAVAVVTGGPGVGKSLLVAAALDAFTPRPEVVLSGTARVHSPAPYDWLAAVLSGRDTTRLDLPADALAWLAQQPTAPRERYAPGTLLRLAVRTVRVLVGAGPAVLVVEDLHALDPASLNLVGELATADGLPALLVVATRPAARAVSPELAGRTLARLCGVRGVVRQHLGPLRPAEVAEVLTQVYPDPRPELVHEVWRRTDGNPYALTELLAAHAGQGLDALLAPAAPPSGSRLPPESSPAVPTSRRAVPESPSPACLTGREAEVLDCLVAGMSNKQVARALGISVRTVTVHVSNLLRKTGTASRTEVALWSVRQRPTQTQSVDHEVVARASAYPQQ
ncbi:LuxR C-terminal-related transcriptional regulator [Verrucosispora sp. WMMD1129]|uniref:helix-turn-helix domain-containing protein n=1 Tax=Verrucosispora sp. WMMD1129 TaxID=3016093 RepID=UPI00249AA00E|nr:LuxR C-terminal-related transcriptional regulator [Verrucosispora sp. WMMD1129]WFE45465.1 LuxR C-terminal-related transcriptional regulator [Verrucosispora sp. WMMD1129]